MPRLTSRSFLHMMPEEVEGAFALPFFAQVVSMEQETVYFRSLEGGESNVQRPTALRRTIKASSVNKCCRQSLGRRPVVVTTVDKFVLGQVVQLDEDKVTVESDGTEIEAPVSDVTEVAPVVALLLMNVVFEKEEWSFEEVESIGAQVLDRILGRGGCSATRDIDAILGGLVSADCIPDAQSMWKWIDPSTGLKETFPLQHAVDYTYYVDGGVDSESGSLFCRAPPSGGIQGRQQPAPPASDDGCHIFDPCADDDVQFSDETVPAPRVSEEARVLGSAKRARGISTPGELTEPSSRRTRLNESSPDVDKDAFIVDKLKADPVLLNRFLQLRDSSPGDESASMMHEEVKPPARPCIVAKPPKSSDMKTKVTFAPSAERQVLHDKLTADRHRGKDPAVYISSQMRSEAVLCKSLQSLQ
ncbi:hypothetical protein PF002_g29599 [Phytophthora fragariae]|uniref:Uncharacterized protein n=3 Tax=Phytophthora fragariae TaxID=53985 RepID=A0A6A3EKU6_9STRA|nr:hypothetical protein PF003_g28159 [Phytophthora fragariae]KAE8932511.1 hypothetical protein PF009_g17461 [Phytophthora fragariae]KAE9172312.1 hypothetical protein PF002_g29599 [Phytophthora fragariae]